MLKFFQNFNSRIYQLTKVQCFNQCLATAYDVFNRGQNKINLSSEHKERHLVITA